MTYKDIAAGTLLFVRAGRQNIEGIALDIDARQALTTVARFYWPINAGCRAARA